MTTATYRGKKKSLFWTHGSRSLIRAHESKWGVQAGGAAVEPRVSEHKQEADSTLGTNPLPNSYQLGPKYSNAGDMSFK